MDNVMERSRLAGQVACGVERPEAVSVQVRVIAIEYTRATSSSFGRCESGRMGKKAGGWDISQIELSGQWLRWQGH